MIRIKSPQDLGAGILFILIGVAGIYFGRELTYGSSMRMGPGYFPFWLSAIILLMGLITGVRGLMFDGPPIEMPQIRPLVMVIAAILSFGLFVIPLGTPLAIIILVFIAAYARPNVNILETAILAVGAAAFAVVAFIYGLGQPLPLWGEF